jgi:hypothetical protein
MSNLSLRALTLVALAALPVSSAHATGMLSPAEVGAQTCPVEWAALATAAPVEVAVFQQMHVLLDLDADVAVAVARAALLGELALSNAEAEASYLAVTASDEAWQAAVAEHDLAYEWTRGRARSDLLFCLFEAARDDRELIFAGVRAANPDVEEETIRANLAAGFQMMDVYMCRAEVLRSVFALDYAHPDLATTARNIFLTELPECES